ncbi:Na+/H+ antiporter NhaC family protein [Pseudoalteromonas denitrificans]|uniref:Na+/H+ antiporter NhaC n=1 Tax=Pseudoalteromonas denitrificans DSM 6059 TaxID=1123010 RepID=A0A1I1H1M0_9GAMM|nr:Na+/H+ antiporter NhaC family protein [Pseudoalteromonas denitrificans]SFC16018.1 Na+/H+ antiporter NhaC [Pseudoalteromonas denitrificans DSM 6059]
MDWITVLPPVVAITIVLWKKEVILALIMAIFTSEFLLAIKDQSTSVLFSGISSIERISAVFSGAGNTRILIFSLLVGALLAYIRHSGGVTATVEMLINKGIAKTPRQVGLMTTFTGMFIFIESNLSVLTSGILSRGLFDKFGMSRARLAYIIDSTAAPICILILLNGWGAYVLALLSGYEFSESAASVLWGTVIYNFYPLITLAIVMFTVITGKVYGPMRHSEVKSETNIQHKHEFTPTKARYMLLPLATMIFSMLAFMFYTGNGDLASGSGSKSILWATSLGCLVAYSMMLISKKFSHQKLVKIGFEGMSQLLPLVTIVLFSLALGASLKELGTGAFIAGVVGEFLPIFLIPLVLFITGGVIAFTTGTSWGTFAILIPLAVPLIHTLGLPPSLVISAVLGGGIFGDHCSPISDTTAVSAIASGCDLLEHVKTQLPYALFAGLLACICYLISGLVLI